MADTKKSNPLTEPWWWYVMLVPEDKDGKGSTWVLQAHTKNEALDKIAAEINTRKKLGTFDPKAGPFKAVCGRGTEAECRRVDEFLAESDCVNLNCIQMAQKEYEELCMEREGLTKKRKALEQQIDGVDEELGRLEKKLKANPVAQKIEEEAEIKEAEEAKAQMKEGARSWVEANVHGCEHMSVEEKKQIQQLKEGVLKGIEEIDIDDEAEVQLLKHNFYRKERGVTYTFDGEELTVVMDEEGDGTVASASVSYCHNHRPMLGSILAMEPKWWLGMWFMAQGIYFEENGVCPCDVFYKK